MGRRPRELICGGTYHVMNRGNRKMPIFEDDRDRRRFLRILMEEMQVHSVELLAGCLMLNHFHLVVITPNGNVSDFMERLEGEFARYSNWRHARVGHLFQGPFLDAVISHDVHLLIALCYVFFNPVSAGLVTRMEDYPWSTYAATVGLSPAPDYLSLGWLDALFPECSRDESQRRLRYLMTEAKPVMAYLRQREEELSVDPDALKRVIRSFVSEQLDLGSLPRTYRSVLRSGLSELFPDGMSEQARSKATYDARVAHGYTLKEIASQLRLHRNTVSRIFRGESTGRST